MTTEQKLDSILQDQKNILANQAYLETMLEPVIRHIIVAQQGEMAYNTQYKAATNVRFEATKPF